MTICRRELRYRRLRAPQEDRTALIEPPPDELGATVGRNRQLREQQDCDLSGRRLQQLAADARRELLDEARRWTSIYRDVAPEPPGGTELVFLAGHQPRLFHPGVWLKNFALGRFARQHAAVAVNLIIDSDTARAAEVKVPTGSPEEPHVEVVPYDRAQPAVPYEERQVADEELLASFGRRAAERIRPLVPDPLVGNFWPMVRSRHAANGNLGACLAQARHQVEGQWGLDTLEVPQGRVCDTPSFRWFAVHLLAEAPRLRGVYNEAVAEYRRVHDIRSAAQPVPDLARRDGWMETPFWVWLSDRPHRRHLFARRRGELVELSDLDHCHVDLPWHGEGGAAAAVERLGELAEGGLRIRSRALITTLWARLVLGELFIHGIGGAKYDQVTDLIIERFFGLVPPEYMVVSATLHLPVEKPDAAPDDLRAIRHELRELRYHPERYLDLDVEPIRRSARQSGRPANPTDSDDPRELVAAKYRWVYARQTPQNARTRCRTIRRLNERLQPHVAGERNRLARLEAETERALQARSVLAARDYAFCLHPERTLREMLRGLLPTDA
jgi:hypothetical protein